MAPIILFWPNRKIREENTGQNKDGADFSTAAGIMALLKIIDAETKEMQK